MLGLYLAAISYSELLYVIHRDRLTNRTSVIKYTAYPAYLHEYNYKDCIEIIESEVIDVYRTQQKNL